MNHLIISRYSLDKNTGFANAACSLRNALDLNGSVYTLDQFKGGNFLSYTSYILLIIFNFFFTRVLFRIFGLVYLRLKICHFLQDINLASQALKLIEKSIFNLIIIETGLLPICVLLIQKKIKRLGFDTKVIPRFHATEDMERLYFSSKDVKFIHFKKLVYLMINRSEYLAATNSYHINFIKNKILLSNPYIIHDKKYYVIPNGIKDNSKKLENKLETKCKLNGNKIRFLFCGKISKVGVIQKGLLDLLDAFSNINENTSELIIIGSGNQLNFLKSKYINNKNIIFTGQISNEDVYSHIDLANFIVLPSRFEGQSIFLIECLSKGKPLIITENTGSSDLVNFNNGFILKIGDTKNLKEVIEEAIRLPYDEWCKMSNNSRTLFDNRHSSHAIAKLCLELNYVY